MSALGGDLTGVGLTGVSSLPILGIPAGISKIANKLDNIADLKKVDALRNGPNGTIVEVSSKKEANQLLNAAFPDYQKVRGVGPEDAQGIRKKNKMARFSKGGAYHKDYAMDKSTGRVRGHTKGNPHGNYPHINIKRKDLKKVMINIIK